MEGEKEKENLSAASAAAAAQRIMQRRNTHSTGRLLVLHIYSSKSDRLKLFDIGKRRGRKAFWGPSGVWLNCFSAKRWGSRS